MDNITPPHHPVALAHQMLHDAKEGKCVAGFYVLITHDDKMITDMAAIKKKDLLWALERAKAKLVLDNLD